MYEELAYFRNNRADCYGRTCRGSVQRLEDGKINAHVSTTWWASNGEEIDYEWSDHEFDDVDQAIEFVQREVGGQRLR